MSQRNEHSVAAQRVAVVVATHEYTYPMEKCLSGFAAQVADPKDVILVDNGSGGKVAEWATTHAPFATTLVRERNGFFCGGYNEGLRHAIEANYDFALIVNADTEVCNPTLIPELLSVAERYPDVAFFGPKVFLREFGNIQNTVLEYPRFTRNFLEFLRHKVVGEKKLASDNCEKRVEFLNGVCVLCRLAAIREIGLLDEVMGGYVEDTDWSWRGRQKGWSSLYTPVNSIIHHQPEVGYEHYALKCFLLRRNTIYWHKKRGANVEAYLYGLFSRILATVRTKVAQARRRSDTDQFQHYAKRLAEVDRGIRSNRDLGDWFGPPLGKF